MIRKIGKGDKIVLLDLENGRSDTQAMPPALLVGLSNLAGQGKSPCPRCWGRGFIRWCGGIPRCPECKGSKVGVA